MEGFCIKEQARVGRSVGLKHFRQGVHPEQMFAPPQNHHRRQAGRHTHPPQQDERKAGQRKHPQRAPVLNIYARPQKNIEKY